MQNKKICAVLNFEAIDLQFQHIEANYMANNLLKIQIDSIKKEVWAKPWKQKKFISLNKKIGADLAMSTTISKRMRIKASIIGKFLY